jgi:hypothetical protein
MVLVRETTLEEDGSGYCLKTESVILPNIDVVGENRHPDSDQNSVFVNH